MPLHDLYAALIDLLLPADCAGCGRPEPPWCVRCRETLGPPRRVELSGGPVVLAAGRYDGPLRSALLRYKERGRRDLVGPLAALLSGLLEGVSAGPVWLVPAPSRRSAARVRGGDHVLRLCHVLAEQCSDVRVAAALRSDRSVRDSVGLDAAQRAANLAGRITVDEAGLPPPGVPVLLVDDVVTTGAMLRTCRSALATEGIFVGVALALCDATTTSR